MHHTVFDRFSVLIPVITGSGTISLVTSTNELGLSSMKGLTNSSIAMIRDFSERQLYSMPWWQTSLSRLGRKELLNSFIVWETSVPEIIHLCRAPGFSVRPMAHLTPFTDSFSCSWFWSKAMRENTCLDYWTTNFPSWNSLWISGCLSFKTFISLMCTGSHLA